MSQGDRQGLLSEEEIKDFIHKKFGLELSRDSLIKPTTNVVVDIDAKFLDEIFGPQWKNLPETDCADSFIKPLMVRKVNFIVTRYDKDTAFQMKDLLRPNRKRNTYFLNILIYVVAQYEDIDLLWQAWDADYAQKKAEIDELQEQLRSTRVYRDELAFKISSGKPIKDLTRTRDELRSRFEESQKYTAELHQKAQAIKSDIERHSKILADKQATGHRLDDKIRELKRTHELQNDNLRVKEQIQILKKSNQTRRSRMSANEECITKIEKKIEDGHKLDSLNLFHKQEWAKKDDLDEKNITKFKKEEHAKEARFEEEIAKQTRLNKEVASKQQILAEREERKNKLEVQIGFKTELAQKDLNSKSANSGELSQPSLSSKEMICQIEFIKKNRAELMKAQQSAIEENKAQADKAERQLETIMKRYEEFKKKTEPTSLTIESYNSRLEAIMGKPKEVELPGNRTYIKEAGDSKN